MSLWKAGGSSSRMIAGDSWEDPRGIQESKRGPAQVQTSLGEPAGWVGHPSNERWRLSGDLPWGPSLSKQAKGT